MERDLRARLADSAAAPARRLRRPGGVEHGAHVRHRRRGDPPAGGLHLRHHRRLPPQHAAPAADEGAGGAAAARPGPEAGNGQPRLPQGARVALRARLPHQQSHADAAHRIPRPPADDRGRRPHRRTALPLGERAVGILAGDLRPLSLRLLAQLPRPHRGGSHRRRRLLLHASHHVPAVEAHAHRPPALGAGVRRRPRPRAAGQVLRRGDGIDGSRHARRLARPRRRGRGRVRVVAGSGGPLAPAGPGRGGYSNRAAGHGAGGVRLRLPARPVQLLPRLHPHPRRRQPLLAGLPVGPVRRHRLLVLLRARPVLENAAAGAAVLPVRAVPGAARRRGVAARLVVRALPVRRLPRRRHVEAPEHRHAPRVAGLPLPVPRRRRDSALGRSPRRRVENGLWPPSVCGRRSERCASIPTSFPTSTSWRADRATACSTSTIRTSSGGRSGTG